MQTGGFATRATINQGRPVTETNFQRSLPGNIFFVLSCVRTHHPSILPSRSRWERRGIWGGCNSVVKEMDLRRWNGRYLNPPVKEETQE